MRVLAINDISCIGKCSLTATLPILSACGVECTVLPTALLSTHTGGFDGYTFHDLTEELPSILAHWKSLGLEFDYIYSGYLGSITQIDLVLQIQAFLAKNGKLIVDPVMGDNGKLYEGFSPAFVEKMRTLCSAADYILPNETEAALLADLPYPLGKEYGKKAVEILSAICPNPIVTGITQAGKTSVFFKEKGELLSLENENVHGFFCGAGDVFASAFVGSLANGKSQAQAIALASDFTLACIHRSAEEIPDKRFGLPFEKEIFPFVKSLLGR